MIPEKVKIDQNEQNEIKKLYGFKTIEPEKDKSQGSKKDDKIKMDEIFEEKKGQDPKKKSE